MEDLVTKALSEAIRQVPSLVVLASVCWMFIRVILRFIKHVEDRGHSVEKRQEEYMELNKQLHQEHMEERQATRKVMSDISSSLNTLTAVVQRSKSQG